MITANSDIKRETLEDKKINKGKKKEEEAQEGEKAEKKKEKKEKKPVEPKNPVIKEEKVEAEVKAAETQPKAESIEVTTANVTPVQETKT